MLITLVHGNLSSGQELQAYGYLTGASRKHSHLSLGTLVKGILLHPTGVTSELWSKRPISGYCRTVRLLVSATYAYAFAGNRCGGEQPICS